MDYIESFKAEAVEFYYQDMCYSPTIRAGRILNQEKLGEYMLIDMMPFLVELLLNEAEDMTPMREEINNEEEFLSELRLFLKWICDTESIDQCSCSFLRGLRQLAINQRDKKAERKGSYDIDSVVNRKLKQQVSRFWKTYVSSIQKEDLIFWLILASIYCLSIERNYRNGSDKQYELDICEFESIKNELIHVKKANADTRRLVNVCAECYFEFHGSNFDRYGDLRYFSGLLKFAEKWNYFQYTVKELFGNLLKTHIHLCSDTKKYYRASDIYIRLRARFDTAQENEIPIAGLDLPISKGFRSDGKMSEYEHGEIFALEQFFDLPLSRLSDAVNGYLKHQDFDVMLKDICKSDKKSKMKTREELYQFLCRIQQIYHNKIILLIFLRLWPKFVSLKLVLETEWLLNEVSDILSGLFDENEIYAQNHAFAGMFICWHPKVREEYVDIPDLSEADVCAVLESMPDDDRSSVDVYEDAVNKIMSRYLEAVYGREGTECFSRYAVYLVRKNVPENIFVEFEDFKKAYISTNNKSVQFDDIDLVKKYVSTKGISFKFEDLFKKHLRDKYITPDDDPVQIVKEILRSLLDFSELVIFR